MLSENEKKIVLYGRYSKLGHWNSQLRNAYEYEKYQKYTNYCMALYSELASNDISILHCTPKEIDFDNLIGVGEETCVTYGSDWDVDWGIIQYELELCYGQD